MYATVSPSTHTLPSSG